MKTLFQVILPNFFVFTTITTSSPKKIGEHSDKVEIQHIRNTTVSVTYENHKVLVDPILVEKGTQPPISFSNQINNPTIQLPVDKYEYKR